jgi:hypothetical protein
VRGAALGGTALFRASAAGALAFHALLLASDGLRGGGDMTPHLRLVQLMGESPALRSVYPPAYHALGALLAPLVGLAAYPKWFAWASAAGLIGSFRFFQRSAELPDAASALFAWAPYGFALTRCLPKVEVAGYALAFLALAWLWRRRYALLAVTLAATFFVHTAAALFLGLCGGVLALARRDARALGALALGSLGALPLVAAHLAAGCTLAQALLFSQGDYLRAAPRLENLVHWDRILVLANPIALVVALRGAGPLWRRHRAVALVCAVVVLLYANELWLAPFGARTTLDLLRGLTIFAFPVACAAGVFLGERPATARGVVAGTAVLAVLSTWLVVPAACVSKPIDVAAVRGVDVDRCMFRWYRRGLPSGLRPQARQVVPDLRLERPGRLERPPQ